MDVDEFRRFRETIPKRRLAASDDVVFEYIDEGVGEPLVLFPPAAGAAHCFYRQVLSLSSKGYRVIAVSYPAIADGPALIQALDVFFDEALSLERFHLLGVGLGGYLAQLFVQLRPTRVQSLIVVNAFTDTSPFRSLSKAIFSILPDFMLQRSALDSLPRNEAIGDPANAAAIDFMVECIEGDLSPATLAARNALGSADPCPLDPQRVRERFGREDAVTIIETLDERSGLTEQQKANLGKYYPGARIALMKRGGSFPFLSRYEEFNMLVEVHLRRHSKDRMTSDRVTVANPD